MTGSSCKSFSVNGSPFLTFDIGQNIDFRFDFIIFISGSSCLANNQGLSSDQTRKVCIRQSP
jgi:hypothetical protein